MNIGKLVLFIVFSTAFLFGCAENQAALEKSGAKPLTGAELQARFSKEVNTTWNTDKNSGTFASRPDGTMSVDWGKGNDTGTWRIVGDTVCRKWKTIREGKELCFTLFKVGEGKYKLYDPDGSYRSESSDI